MVGKFKEENVLENQFLGKLTEKIRSVPSLLKEGFGSTTNGKPRKVPKTLYCKDLPKELNRE